MMAIASRLNQVLQSQFVDFVFIIIICNCDFKRFIVFDDEVLGQHVNASFSQIDYGNGREIQNSK